MPSEAEQSFLDKWDELEEADNAKQATVEPKKRLPREPKRIPPFPQHLSAANYSETQLGKFPEKKDEDRFSRITGPQPKSTKGSEPRSQPDWNLIAAAKKAHHEQNLSNVPAAAADTAATLGGQQIRYDDEVPDSVPGVDYFPDKGQKKSRGNKPRELSTTRAQVNEAAEAGQQVASGEEFSHPILSDVQPEPEEDWSNMPSAFVTSMRSAQAKARAIQLQEELNGGNAPNINAQAPESSVRDEPVPEAVQQEISSLIDGQSARASTAPRESSDEGAPQSSHQALPQHLVNSLSSARMSQLARRELESRQAQRRAQEESTSTRNQPASEATQHHAASKPARSSNVRSQPPAPLARGAPVQSARQRLEAFFALSGAELTEALNEACQDDEDLRFNQRQLKAFFKNEYPLARGAFRAARIDERSERYESPEPLRPLRDYGAINRNAQFNVAAAVIPKKQSLPQANANANADADASTSTSTSTGSSPRGKSAPVQQTQTDAENDEEDLENGCSNVRSQPAPRFEGGVPEPFDYESETGEDVRSRLMPPRLIAPLDQEDVADAMAEHRTAAEAFDKLFPGSDFNAAATHIPPSTRRNPTSKKVLSEFADQLTSTEHPFMVPGARKNAPRYETGLRSGKVYPTQEEVDAQVSVAQSRESEQPVAGPSTEQTSADTTQKRKATEEAETEEPRPRKSPRTEKAKSTAGPSTSKAAKNKSKGNKSGSQTAAPRRSPRPQRATRSATRALNEEKSESKAVDDQQAASAPQQEKADTGKKQGNKSGKRKRTDDNDEDGEPSLREPAAEKQSKKRPRVNKDAVKEEGGSTSAGPAKKNAPATKKSTAGKTQAPPKKDNKRKRDADEADAATEKPSNKRPRTNDGNGKDSESESSTQSDSEEEKKPARKSGNKGKNTRKGGRPDHSYLAYSQEETDWIENHFQQNSGMDRQEHFAAFNAHWNGRAPTEAPDQPRSVRNYKSWYTHCNRIERLKFWLRPQEAPQGHPARQGN